MGQQQQAGGKGRAYAGGSPTFQEMGPALGGQSGANAGQLGSWDSGQSQSPASNPMAYAGGSSTFNEAGGGSPDGKGGGAGSQWGSQGGKGTGGMGGKGGPQMGMQQGGSALGNALSQRMQGGGIKSPESPMPGSEAAGGPSSMQQNAWTPTANDPEELQMMAGLSNGSLQDNNSYWQQQLLHGVGGNSDTMNNLINNHGVDWGRAAYALHAGTDPSQVASQFGYTPQQIAKLQTMMAGHYGG